MSLMTTNDPQLSSKSDLTINPYADFILITLII